MVKLRDLMFIKALLPIRFFGGGSTGSGAGDMSALPYFIAGNQQMLNDQAGNTALAIDTAAVRQWTCRDKLHKNNRTLLNKVWRLNRVLIGIISSVLMGLLLGKT